MNLLLGVKCHRSSDWPCIRIWVNDRCYIDRITDTDRQFFDVQFDPVQGTNTLVVEHWDKQESDTWCDQSGCITADRAIEIESLSIDGFDVPRNIVFSKHFFPVWPAHFVDPPVSITDNNWLGFNGRWIFDFDMPFDKTYYGYYWQMELEANAKFQKTDVGTNEDYCEAYGLRIKVDESFNYTLTDLKRMIEENQSPIR